MSRVCHRRRARRRLSERGRSDGSQSSRRASAGEQRRARARGSPGEAHGLLPERRSAAGDGDVPARGGRFHRREAESRRLHTLVLRAEGRGDGRRGRLPRGGAARRDGDDDGIAGGDFSRRRRRRGKRLRTARTSDGGANTFYDDDGVERDGGRVASHSGTSETASMSRPRRDGESAHGRESGPEFRTRVFRVSPPGGQPRQRGRLRLFPVGVRSQMTVVLSYVLYVARCVAS